MRSKQHAEQTDVQIGKDRCGSGMFARAKAIPSAISQKLVGGFGAIGEGWEQGRL